MAENVDQRLESRPEISRVLFFMHNKRAAHKSKPALKKARENVAVQNRPVETPGANVRGSEVSRENRESFDDGRPDVELEKLSCEFREHVYVFRVRVFRDLLLLVHDDFERFALAEDFQKVLAKRL